MLGHAFAVEALLREFFEVVLVLAAVNPLCVLTLDGPQITSMPHYRSERRTARLSLQSVESVPAATPHSIAIPDHASPRPRPSRLSQYKRDSAAMLTHCLAHIRFPSLYSLQNDYGQITYDAP